MIEAASKIPFNLTCGVIIIIIIIVIITHWAL